MERSKVGCVGAGHHAKWVLYPALRTFEDVDIVAVCDPDESRLRYVMEVFGVRAG